MFYVKRLKIVNHVTIWKMNDFVQEFFLRPLLKYFKYFKLLNNRKIVKLKDQNKQK